MTLSLRRAFPVALLLATAHPALAQQSPPARQPVAAPARPPATEAAEPGDIMDNSFLLEEAYNQEPGVVQHISAFQRSYDSKDWVYTFTQEWPVPGQRHQLSYVLPILKTVGAPDGAASVGDVALNYRYQLVNQEGRVAVAPRFSVLLPTGNHEQARGAGGVGAQVNVPVSVNVVRRLVTHLNAGVTVTPRARDAEGHSASTTSFNAGQSLIWLAATRFNVMLEFLYVGAESVTGPSTTERSHDYYLSPGVRGAFNFTSGLQIVPGIAVPIGVGPTRGRNALFLYLSLEHPMWTPR